MILSLNWYFKIKIILTYLEYLTWSLETNIIKASYNHDVLNTQNAEFGVFELSV